MALKSGPILKLLTKLYYDIDSPCYLAGINALLRESKRFDKNVTRTDVERFLHEQDTYVTHKPARKRFPRRKTTGSGLNGSFQMDLIDLQRLKKSNKGVGYIMSCVDSLSRYYWAIPIKTKSARDVINGFKQILDTGRVCLNLITDNGKEFWNKEFQEF